MNLKPDIFIEVRFKTTAEGGRDTPIAIPVNADYHYGCPLFVGGEGFDCRFLVKGLTYHLGVTYEVPIKFLFPDLALSKISEGIPVTLWEGKEIATGKVVRFA